MTMRTPLGRVRGLGSARSGTEDFWYQRLTAIASVPLVIGFVVIVTSLLGRNHSFVIQTLASPLVAITMLLFIVAVTWHMKLGVQIIIEDYVHGEGRRLVVLIANTFFSIVICLSCVYAILKLSVGV